MRAVVYGWSTCSFCQRAKGVLERNGVPFREELLDGKREVLARIQEQFGRRTVPIVLLDGELVGGLEELESLERAGALAESPAQPARESSPAVTAPVPSLAALAKAPRRRHLLALLALALIVLASRAPFLGPGFGVDSDAWRLASASRELSVRGHYAYSRPPGYPVPEIVGALFWRGGAFALTGLSALACTAGALLVALLVRRTNPRAAIPAALAFAFTPVVYVASTSSMDLLWAQAFALGALLCASSGRALACGIALGLMIGSRLPSGVVLLPCALLLARGAGGLRRALVASSIALALAALCYLPVVLRYGLAELAPTLGQPPRFGKVIARSTVQVYGQLGTVAVVLAAVVASVSSVRRRAGERAQGDATLAAALLLGLALVAAVFLSLPYESGYLVPFVALLMPLFGLRLRARAAWLLAGALVLSSFFGASGEPLGPGPIVRDHRIRVREDQRLRQILRAARAVQPPPIVVAGPWEPKLDVLAGGARDGRVEYVFALQPHEAEALHAAGRQIVFIDGIERWHLEHQGVALAELGARPLFGDARAER